MMMMMMRGTPYDLGNLHIGDIIMITKGWLYLAMGMAMNVAEQY